jgi:hypothetical protein
MPESGNCIKPIYYLEKRSCGIKYRFHSEIAAICAIRSLEKNGKKRGQLHAYTCNFCLYWHIGHETKKSKKLR